MITNTYETFQDAVNGYIGHILIDETDMGKKVVIIYNECGELLNLPFNRKLGNREILVGTFFITSIDPNGDGVSLSNKEADYYISSFQATKFTYN